jgi:hypothetical protein
MKKVVRVFAVPSRSAALAVALWVALSVALSTRCAAQTSLQPLANASVRVSGTQVSLVPPQGFRAATRFSGFENVEAQASIMITELPGPLSEVTQMLVPERMATQRMTLLSRSDEKLNGGDAILAAVAQRFAGDDFLKWMLIAGDETKTRMIVATFPKDKAATLKEAMRQSLLSATWTHEAVDPFDGLSYTLQAAGTLKLAGRVSNAVMFTESGKQRTSGPDEALFIFGSSIADRDLSDLKAFSEARLMETVRLKAIKITSSTPIMIRGLKAHQIIAEATHEGTETPMLLYQTLIADAATYYVAQGRVSANRGAEWLPYFTTATNSFVKR